jgi:hypothetical protein
MHGKMKEKKRRLENGSDKKDGKDGVAKRKR